MPTVVNAQDARQRQFEDQINFLTQMAPTTKSFNLSGKEINTKLFHLEMLIAQQTKEQGRVGSPEIADD